MRLSNIYDWPHKWFGVWKEYGEHYKDYPSAKDFVDPKANGAYDKERLIKYLKDGFAVVATSRRYFPSPFTGEIARGSISYRTDGKWVWLDDLPDYIAHHHVAIPVKWYAYIKENNFTIPDLNFEELDLEKLDMPGAKR